MNLTRGQHLLGKILGTCVLEKLLGHGGSSAVFLAQQHNPDRKVAVKVFLPRPNMNAQMRRDFHQRFIHEAEVACQLDHPNIMPVYSYGEQDSIPYIIMPYMSGGTLSEYITKHGALSLQDALWYLQQIASALDYSHEHHCVHCDVKPANILLDSDGHIVLSDFGIAHIAQSNDNATPMSNPNALRGTPDFISPEQAMGYAIDGRSDIYSLGVTLYYLLANKLPFKADSTLALALLHLNETAPSLALIRADVTPAIDEVIHKALAKSPEQRFQSAGAFCAAFAEAVHAAEAVPVTGKSARVLAHQASLLGSMACGPPIRRSRVWMTGGALLWLAAIVTLFSVGYMIAPIVLGHAYVKTSVTAQSSATDDDPSGDLLTDHDDWPESRSFFYDDQQKQYHILNTSLERVPLRAIYQNHEYSDFQMTVTMAEIHSPNNSGDYYGIVFRSAPDQSRYYLFEVRSSGGGQYTFWRSDNQWVTSGPLPSLALSTGKSNTITIEARGNTFTFSVNQHRIGKTFRDPSEVPLLTGEIGLCVEEEGTEIAFSDLYITALK